MKTVKQLILEDAAFYDSQMNPVKLSMFVQQLENYSPFEIERAMRHFRNEKNRKQMPMPGDLIAFFNPAVDDDSAARDVASRIGAAVRKFGYNNWPQAQAYIGEIGEIIVQRNGGWGYLCENLMEDQMGTFTAQARDLAKAQIQIARTGGGSEAPKLPPSQRQGLQSVGQIMSNITIGKKQGDE